MKVKSVWFFEDVNLFKLLCPHKLRAYKKKHKFNNYKKKEFIYLEENYADNLFIITEGKVKIGYYNKKGDEVVTTILKRGELFGESAIFESSALRKEFAQSIDNKTCICSVNINRVHKLMKTNQEFSFKIYKFVGFKLKKIERHLRLLLFKDAKTRLIEFLKDLSVDYGAYCNANKCNIIEHPYTQKDIASLLGISRPTLNVLLNKLEKEKLITINRNKIMINKL